MTRRRGDVCIDLWGRGISLFAISRSFRIGRFSSPIRQDNLSAEKGNVMSEPDPVVAGPDPTGPFNHPVTYEDDPTEDHAPGVVESGDYQAPAEAGGAEVLPPLASGEPSTSFSDSIRAARGGAK
jgi:hypothetical protein